MTIYRNLFVFIICISICISLYPQEGELIFPLATKEKRDEYKLQMQKWISKELELFTLKKDESTIKKSLFSMQILNYTEEDGFLFLKLALKDYPIKSESFYSKVLETVFTLYQTGFEEEMEFILNNPKNVKHFAIAINYLLRNKLEGREIYLNLLLKKYKTYEKDPTLKVLIQYLENSPDKQLNNRPPLHDLLAQNFGENHFVIYSFHRLNRDYPGLVIIKKPDGSFLRREDGSIYSISHLAKSISNLPYYVENGNTPQGIFSIQKVQTVKNEVIGPTPAIITAMPFEISTNKFFHISNKNNSKWNLKLYLNLFPDSWKEYFPIQEAYFAGEIGRSGIYAHGTTVDTDFFVGNNYYPNTPTRGCLSAKEIWSKKTGVNIYSDQISLLKAVKSLEPANGYLVVVELDDKQTPVSLDEVLMDILEVEGK